MHRTPASRPTRRALLVLATLGLALAGRAEAASMNMSVGVLVPSRTNDWDRWDSWEDWDDTLLRMQRENLATQEEQAREAGRSTRRNELEADREKASQERGEYFDAVIEASRASLRAPAGVPYRRPGHTSGEAPPEGTPVVSVGGIPYLFDRGVFWLQQGDQYLVVTAPLGAAVPALPRGSVPVRAGERAVWYYFGAFFAGDPGGYTVIAPPPGVTVYYLPDGYTREKVGGVDVFRFGDTLYRPVFIQGVLAYQVTGG